MKKNKGITLIALIITIVILIILAGVAISLRLGENGIFKKAAKAKEDTLVAQNEESMQIAETTNSIDGIVGSSDRGTNGDDWIKIGTATGSNKINYDVTKYKELYFFAYSTQDAAFTISRNVYTEYLTNTKMQFAESWGTQYYGNVCLNNSYIYCGGNYGYNDITSTYTLVLYGKEK